MVVMLTVIRRSYDADEESDDGDDIDDDDDVADDVDVPVRLV